MQIVGGTLGVKSLPVDKNFATRLESDQAKQYVLDPNCMTLMVFLKEIVEENNSAKKKNNNQQSRGVKLFFYSLTLQD